MKKLFLLLLLLLLLLLSLGLSAISYASESNYSSEGKKTLYDQKGSNSGPTMSGYNNYLSPWKYAFEIVEKPHPVRYGSTSEQYELREGDCGDVSDYSDCEENLARSEIVLDALLIQARYNQDIWYGWSFYNETIPTMGLYNVIGQWKNGVKNQNDDVLQIRQTPQDSFNPTMWENCDSTFCSNHLVTKDSYDVTVNLGHGGRFKSKGNSNNWNMPCRLWSMEENKGKWVDIVINTNFGSNDDGYVNVWINGEKRCEYQGVLQDYVPRFPGHNQTAISGESEYPGPSHRRGIFINKNKMTTKTHPTLIAYYDEFRVGKSRKEVDIRMIEDPNYEPPKDRCVIGFIYKNNRCTLDVSNKYDGQYTMYLYRSYPDRNDKNIINATIEIKDGLLKVSDDSYRWIHKKIDDPLESFRGNVDSKGNVDWSMEIDPWKKSQFLSKVIFEGNLDKDESITGKYDEGTGLRIELKKKD